MNGDRLYQINDPEKVRATAFGVLDSGQGAPELQLQATAIAFLAMCEATNTDVRQLLVSGERMMRAVDSPFSPTIRAIKEYAKNEIGGAR